MGACPNDVLGADAPKERGAAVAGAPNDVPNEGAAAAAEEDRLNMPPWG